MSELLKISELNFLRNDGIKYYKWICFLRDGKFLLESTINKQKVIGKALKDSSEEELDIWPQLHHENINRLLKVMSIDNHLKILISPSIGKSIDNLIHEDSFNKHPLCFDRKKSYIRGVLSALRYMHRNKVFNLNLNGENIAVCSHTDKAILCDFTYTVAKERITKRSLPPNRHYRPPEVQNGEDSDAFDSSAIDIWDCGVLFFQMITQHLLPYHGLVSYSLEFLETSEILQKANSGANLQKEVARECRAFIEHLLSEKPEFRPPAEIAFRSNFLKTARNQQDRKYRHAWKNKRDLFTERDQFDDWESDFDATDTSYYRSDNEPVTWTKSMPNTRILTEVSNSPRSVFTNSPSLPSRIDGAKNTRKEAAYGNILANWDVDIQPQFEDDVCVFPYPESLANEEEEFSKCPCFNLEDVLSETASVIAFASPNRYTSSSTNLKDLNQDNEPSICEESEWIDIPLQHYQGSLQFITSLNENETEKKIVSKNKHKTSSKNLKQQKPDSTKLNENSNLDQKLAADKVGTKKSENKKIGGRKWYHNLCPRSHRRRENRD